MMSSRVESAEEFDPKKPLPLRLRVACLINALVFVLGLMVMWSWWVGKVTFSTPVSELPSMKMNTALCLSLLAGSGIVFIAQQIYRGGAPWGYWLSNILSAVALVISGLGLFSYAVPSLGLLDQWLVNDTITLLYPGRMSVMTAFCLFNLAAFGLIRGNTGALVPIRDLLAWVTISVLMLALMGYVSDASQLLKMLPFSTMAPHTVIALTLLLVAGILCLPIESGGVSLILQSGTVGRAFRWDLTVLLLIPVMIGCAIELMLSAGAIEASIARTLFILSLLSALMIRAYFTARRGYQREHLLVVGHQERMQALEALQSSEIRFRRVVDGSSDGLIAVDEQGHIRIVNRSVRHLFGYEPEELIGLPIETLIPLRFRKEHPAFRARYHESPQRRQMSGRVDLYALRKDGSEFPVEIGLNPLEMDQALWVLATVNDISLQKKARLDLENALREKERLLRVSQALFDSHLGMMRTLLDGTQEIGGAELGVEWYAFRNRFEALAGWYAGEYARGNGTPIPAPQLMQALCRIILPLVAGRGITPEVNEVDPAIGLGLGQVLPMAVFICEVCAATTVPSASQVKDAEVTVGLSLTIVRDTHLRLTLALTAGGDVGMAVLPGLSKWLHQLVGAMSGTLTADLDSKNRLDVEFPAPT